MQKTTFHELMMASLSLLLEPNETLSAPIYGTIYDKRNRHCFAYFGLTEAYLLIALLQGSRKKIAAAMKIPLEGLQDVTVKRSIIPYQKIIFLSFSDGVKHKIRVSDKVYKFPEQQQNVQKFIRLISN